VESGRHRSISPTPQGVAVARAPEGQAAHARTMRGGNGRRVLAQQWKRRADTRARKVAEAMLGAPDASGRAPRRPAATPTAGPSRSRSRSSASASAGAGEGRA
jgi:hypothetical protein